MIGKKNVSTPSRESMNSDVTLEKVRALRGGVTAMRAAGETYLPKEELESTSDYKDRVARSWLFPALDKTISDVSDKVFAREVVLGDDVPEQLKSLETDITNDGQNLNNFSKNVFEDGVEAGISFILVDCPAKTADMTVDEQNESNFRPYFSHIKAEDILGWKTESIDNVVSLVQVRIAETATEEDAENEFEQLEVEQIRVIDRIQSGGTHIRLYRKNLKAEWVLHDEFSVEINQITLVPFYTERIAYFQAKPPFEKLADLNIAHWQSASDQRNILHKARVPLLFFKGIEKKEMTASSTSATWTTNEAADMKFVEHTGKAIGAGREDLKDLEFRMQALGMELMLPKTGNTTATGEAIDSAKATTPLSQMANNMKEALEKALQFAADYLGIEDGGTVQVNTDFGLSLLSQADLTFLLNAVNTRQISRETFLKETMRRNVLMDDLIIEDEIERLGSELPSDMEDDDALDLDDGEDGTVIDAKTAFLQAVQ